MNEKKNQEEEDDDAAYMPYDILEEEEDDDDDGESMVILVSRGAGVVVRKVSDRVSQFREAKPKIIPTRHVDVGVGVGETLNALGKLVTEYEQVGYHMLEKNLEFGRLITTLSRRGGRGPWKASSKRRDLRNKRRRTKEAT